MFDIQKMMKQAQKMQAEMEKVQEEMANTEVTGTAGGGSVEVVCSGKHEFKSVKISPDAAGDAEMLEDLILAALKDATQKVESLSEEKMSGIKSGLNMPGLKLPF
ncbi:MAG: YbaB/EbfC family nucleoid-associated protein [Vampirovibrio sp.]|nr:YbaB/EbfC family nucleoid-associated protein [Vampirovibrio sp.]